MVGWVNPADSYKILLIGETGSGKTSFLNFLWNSKFVLELGLETALDRFENFNDIKLENPKAGAMESKTSDAKLYPHVKLAKDLKVSIIDTPGFGDSRGLSEDKEHTKRIVRVLERAEFINCICLVINGSMARMSATLKYVLTEVSAILPIEVLDNIIVVFTNIADPLDLNFDSSELRKFIGRDIEQDRVFLINNPYCRVEKAKRRSGKMDSKMIAKSLKKSFDEARDMLTEMCGTIKSFQKVHTHHFVTLYETKQQIDREVTDLLMAYENQMELEKMISQAEKEAEAAQRAKNLHCNYRSTQTFKRWVRIETDRHNTLCRAKGCFKNCHEGCNLEKSLDSERFKRCACIQSNGYCKVCNHHYKDHYHNESLHKQVEETVALIDEKGKRKFQAAQSEEEKARIYKQQLSDRREASEEMRKKLSCDLLLTIEKFQKLGVTRSYAKVLRTQLSLVEQRLEGEDADQYEDLAKTKEEIEARCKVVELTLSEPLSHDADPVAQKSWACAVLGVPLKATKTEVERAYKDKAKTSHPDKPGGDDEYFTRVQHAKDVLLHNKT